MKEIMSLIGVEGRSDVVCDFHRKFCCATIARSSRCHSLFVHRGAKMFFAWEDARNDCLGLLGESVSGAGGSHEHPAPREEE
jgi:hypothetical protein